MCGDALQVNLVHSRVPYDSRISTFCRPPPFPFQSPEQIPHPIVYSNSSAGMLVNTFFHFLYRISNCSRTRSSSPAKSANFPSFEILDTVDSARGRCVAARLGRLGATSSSSSSSTSISSDSGVSRDSTSSSSGSEGLAMKGAVSGLLSWAGESPCTSL